MARSKELITPRLNQAQQAIETLRQTIDYVQTQPEVRLRAAIAEAGRHVQELRKRLEFAHACYVASYPKISQELVQRLH